MQRLWARAFVIVSPCNGKRIVIVNADLGMIFQGIKQQVVKKLQEKYGQLYSDENVLLTAIHTHSGPGGFSTYAFYNLTTLGFEQTNFNAIVDGIVNAIARAHDNLQPANIKFAKSELPDISFNRSPTSYLLNPLNERANYARDVDIDMSLLRFENKTGVPFGLINWFPLHGVSINNKNELINGDNKGFAEYLFEQDYQSDYGSHDFVAAFAQANAGDVSPNQLGHEGGAGLAGIVLAEQAGTPQYLLAKKLFNAAQDEITGGIDYRHVYVAMDKLTVNVDQSTYQTCPAAIGVSMLAGTKDGEGIGEQGVTCDNVSKMLPHFFCEQSRTPCQGVKPIVLSTGTKQPYPWTPNILPLQILKIGNIIIVAAPFELTTMTGRRIRAAVKAYFPAEEIIIAALSNAYAGYVATNEEYQLQRYEGASTHFGPWTQSALSQQFGQLAKALAENAVLSTGPMPPDLSAHQMHFRPGVVMTIRLGVKNLVISILMLEKAINLPRQ